jgi:LPXTG-motif cell wall-anchored protein
MLSRYLSQRINRVVACAITASAVGLMLSSSAAAQSWNKKTTVTFSAPIEIPGVGTHMLPAGTYIFKLLDSQSDRHIVQVFSQDGKHVYATILAVPNYRLKATDKTVMTFSERSAGTPQAIRAWFYPGDNSGQEFVYPKRRAVELATATNQPVLYVPDEMAPNIVAPAITANEPPVIALKSAPVMAVLPSGDFVPATQVVETPPETTSSLPKTASNLPLLALIGLLSLGAGLSLRRSCAR